MRRVVVVAEPGIGAGTIINALIGVLGAGRGAGSLQLLAAGFAERQVGMAVRVGAVYETVAGLLTVLATLKNDRVHAVHVHGYAVIEYVALAVKILAPGLNTVLDNAAV